MNFFSATTRQLQEASEPSPADLGAVIERASASIAGIVEAAERAAAEIRADASATLPAGAETVPAGRERLLAELVATLADRAEGLSRDARELAATLERAGAQLVPTVAPVAAVPSEPLRFEEASEEARVDAIRLLATQMAVAGSSREEIAARLEQEFGLAGGPS